MTGYPVDRVHHEVAYLGRHVHWTLEEVLGLDHAQRLRWVDEVNGQVRTELSDVDDDGDWRTQGRWA